MFIFSWFHLDRSSPVCSFYVTRTECWRGGRGVWRLREVAMIVHLMAKSKL